MTGSLFVLRIHDAGKIKDKDGVKIFGVRIPTFLPEGWIHLPNTGPPKKLLYAAKDLEKKGMWNEQKFRTMYLPSYLSYIKSKEAILEFNEIKRHLDDNVNVFYACYCKDEHLCHRSIVKRIFEIREYDVHSI